MVHFVGPLNSFLRYCERITQASLWLVKLSLRWTPTMASHISRRMAGILRMPSQQTVSWLNISMSMLPKDGRILAPSRKSWINHESSIFVHGNSHESSHQNRGSFFNDRQAWLWEFGISVAKESTFRSRSSASRWRWNVKRMRPWGQALEVNSGGQPCLKISQKSIQIKWTARINRNHGRGKWQNIERMP